MLDFWLENLVKARVINIIPFQAIVLSILEQRKFTTPICGVGDCLITIDSDGDCYSCDELLKPRFKIGDIYSGVKQKKLVSENYLRFCVDCNICYICGGRCFREQIEFPLEKFQFYCEMTRILVKAIQDKIPQIQSMISSGIIKKDNLKYDCWVEEIP